MKLDGQGGVQMSEFLLAGTVLGAAVGFVHMLYILSRRLGRPGLSMPKTLWHGIFTWCLWALFGAYVLAFWILGLVCLGMSRLLRRMRGAV